MDVIAEARATLSGPGSPARLSAIVLFAALSVSSLFAAEQSRVPIADFAPTIQSNQGGFFRCVGGTPNQIVDQMTPVGEPLSDAWRIEFYEIAPVTGIGVLIPLFDERSMPLGRPLTMTQGQELCLRILGDLNSRKLSIEIVSGTNVEASGLVVGTVDSNELGSRKWHEFRLPMPPEVSKTNQPGFIRILAEGKGAGWFAIDSLALVQSGALPAEPSPVSSAKKTLRKVLWVWKSNKILPEPKEVEALIKLCSLHGITDLLLNVPYSYENDVVQMQMIEQQRAFLAAAHARGITVHALDGGRDYVLRANHARMLDLLDALGKFNQGGAPAQRYAAIHLDNEPYLLAGWSDESERSQIIREYIELYQKLRPRADSLGMELGVDIPFWWDDRDRDGQPKLTYDTEADKQPLLEALFPLIHNVGIMSYRKRVTGPNGIVFHCLNEFELGKKLGVDVFASMELGTGDDVEQGTTFGAYRWPYFHGQLDTLERILSHTPGSSGIAIHYYEPFAEAMK